MQRPEIIKESIDKTNARIEDLLNKRRELTALLKRADLEEIQKTIKEVQLEPKEITALLEAYSKGIIELPDELREELEEDDEE